MRRPAVPAARRASSTLFTRHLTNENMWPSFRHCGRNSPRNRFRARQLMSAGLACSMVLVAGCKPTESVQWGYRGNSMTQLYNPKNVAKLTDINAIPEPEPGEAYDPTFPMATEVHQNIQVLTDLNALELARLMNAMTTWIAPEQGCEYCHNTENLADDSKYTKLVARQMLTMTRDINANWQDHVVETGVTCWTCHRGQAVPSDIWFTTPPPKTPSAHVTGWKGGQNVGGVKNSGNAALPYDPLTPFLLEANEIRIQGTEPLPYGNRQSIKQAEWTYALMMYMSKSLGVNCTYCHQTRAMGIWEESTPQRVTAWHGIRMVRSLNQDHLVPLKDLYPKERLGPTGDAPKAACATCHKGTYKPLYGQSMLGDYPSLRGVLPGRLSPDPTKGGTIPISVAPEGAAIATMEERTSMAEALLAAAEGATVEAGEPATESPPIAAEEAPAVAEGEGAAPAEPAETETAEAEPSAAKQVASTDSAAAEAEAGPSGDEAADTGTEATEVESLVAEMRKAHAEAMRQAERRLRALQARLDQERTALNQQLEVLRTQRDEAKAETPARDGDREQADTLAAGLQEAEASPAPTALSLLSQQAGRLGPRIEDMTVGEVESALGALLELLGKLGAVRAQLDAAMPTEPAGGSTGVRKGDGGTSAVPSASDEKENEAPPEPLEPSEPAQVDTAATGSDATGGAGPKVSQATDSSESDTDARAVTATTAAAESHAQDLAAEVERLRAELKARTAEPSDAEVLDDAQARIVAMQARLDQETEALEQQLEVVRGQRDRTADTVAVELRDTYAGAVEDAEKRLKAVQARLDQERTALSQQLEVVRAQRDEALAEVRSRIAEWEHAAALAEAEQEISAIEARLDQQAHALGQQLELVRRQRDEARQEVAARIPADEHAAAIAALEARINAVQARLDQNIHALQQQLHVVRAQRDTTAAQAVERIAQLEDEHAEALEAMEARLAAREVRLAQEREALNQQLAVVRRQRDLASGTPAEEEAAAAQAEEPTGEEPEGRSSTDEAPPENRALAEAAESIGGEMTDAGVRLALGGDRLRFASGSAALPAAELPDLDRTAKLLAERPELSARIEGHTDSVGSRALNQSLSQQRAEAVMAALVQRGVDAARLTAEGIGPDRPIASNDTPAGRSQNRRVEIYVTAQDQMAAGSTAQ